ncbi:hypothetical protein TNCV_4925211 [Trichonephila clavipes]|nr:hypothetical protein TNCV_4925211 [Trichonephila clavipes]
MLIQPASWRPRLVRVIVSLLENSITERMKEQYKRMKVITQQFYELDYIEEDCIPSVLSSRNRDSSLHATRLHSSTLQSLCVLAQTRRTVRWRSLIHGTLEDRRPRNPHGEASVEQPVYSLCTCTVIQLPVNLS